MKEFLLKLLDWSEVWAPLIPLSMLFFRRNQPGFLKPVIVYLFFAFFINLAGDIIDRFKHDLPAWMHSNNPLYNIHSVIRFICFSIFFTALGQTSFVKLRYILPAFSLVVILVNFGFVENFGNPDHLSGNLLAAEAYLLLIYCMLYYLAKLRDDEDDVTSGPDFWVVTGLSIYVVVNFFVFLFYVPMLNADVRLAINIWNVHNVAYIILCIFIIKAFYEPARHQLAV
jgi:hypothetical protein